MSSDPVSQRNSNSTDQYPARLSGLCPVQPVGSGSSCMPLSVCLFVFAALKTHSNSLSNSLFYPCSPWLPQHPHHLLLDNCLFIHFPNYHCQVTICYTFISSSAALHLQFDITMAIHIEIQLIPNLRNILQLLF